MFAAITKLKIDPAHASAAASAFTNEILPRITLADGFSGGYWLEPADGEGLGFVLFETEAQARQATPPALGMSAPGVTILKVEIRRVAVSVPGAQPYTS